MVRMRMRMRMGVVKRRVAEQRLVYRLEGDGPRELRCLGIFRSFGPKRVVVAVVIVDGIGGAPLGRIVWAARTERRVFVPACHRQCHRTSGAESREGVASQQHRKRLPLFGILGIGKPTP